MPLARALSLNDEGSVLLFYAPHQFGETGADAPCGNQDTVMPIGCFRRRLFIFDYLNCTVHPPERQAPATWCVAEGTISSSIFPVTCLSTPMTFALTHRAVGAKAHGLLPPRGSFDQTPGRPLAAFRRRFR